MVTATSFRSTFTAMRWLTIFAAALLVLSSCGSEDAASDEVTAVSSATSSDTVTETTTGSTPNSVTDTSVDDSSTVDRSEWPGEKTEISIAEGVVSVVGVEFDDVLNIRSGPGASFEILNSLDPTGTVTVTGEIWLNNGSWYEVTSGDETGWVASSFVAYLGPTDDATAEIDPTGNTFEAATMLELAELVAQTQTSESPPSRVAQVSDTATSETADEITGVTIDVTDIGEIAVFGYRLHISGEPGETGDSFELSSVERTTLCARGLTNGLCS